MHPMKLLKSLFCMLKAFTKFTAHLEKMFSAGYQIVACNVQNLMGYEKTFKTKNPAKICGVCVCVCVCVCVWVIRFDLPRKIVILSFSISNGISKNCKN